VNPFLCDLISIVVVLITEKALFVVVYQESAKINAKHEAEARGQEREKINDRTHHLPRTKQNFISIWKNSVRN